MHWEQKVESFSHPDELIPAQVANDNTPPFLTMKITSAPEYGKRCAMDVKSQVKSVQALSAISRLSIRLSN
jgi:hypothetical protein